jgi:hypothetical protein
MNLVEATQRHAVRRPELFCPLAQSPSAAIRWRFMDYEQLLTKQLKLLAGPEFSASSIPRANGWEQD